MMIRDTMYRILYSIQSKRIGGKGGKDGCGSIYIERDELGHIGSLEGRQPCYFRKPCYNWIGLENKGWYVCNFSKVLFVGNWETIYKLRTSFS